MADRTDYRDPNVTTTRDDKSSSSSGWIKWVLIALAVLAALWLLFSLFDTEEEVTTIPATDTDAVVVEEGTDATVVPVTPVD
ncbi:hypothetical protein [Jannaschia formosa]|uniref:hypothetical protein n=1 Tax=Jannaschia formosa TaxID=2259592 RepID=UPI000E1B675D|nr:hypothetical protein [Jannaschia formosa]TFL18870.1 hypothetical protein DR046_08095 [Jannaschia formosa]